MTGAGRHAWTDGNETPEQELATLRSVARNLETLLSDGGPVAEHAEEHLRLVYDRIAELDRDE